MWTLLMFGYPFCKDRNYSETVISSLWDPKYVCLCACVCVCVCEREREREKERGREREEKRFCN